MMRWREILVDRERRLRVYRVEFADGSYGVVSGQMGNAEDTDLRAKAERLHNVEFGRQSTPSNRRIVAMHDLGELDKVTR